MALTRLEVLYLDLFESLRERQEECSDVMLSFARVIVRIVVRIVVRVVGQDQCQANSVLFAS